MRGETDGTGPGETTSITHAESCSESPAPTEPGSGHWHEDIAPADLDAGAYGSPDQCLRKLAQLLAKKSGQTVLFRDTKGYIRICPPPKVS